MSYDDDLEPKLGKVRSRGGKGGRRYVQRVLAAAALAGGRTRLGSSLRHSGFQGNRIGRGAGVGRVLGARDRYAAFRIRRVVIKSRIVKLRGQGLKAAKLHLRYIQRDGVTREGMPGELYDAASNQADGKAMLERSESDRHQFRFIVSAEDADEYEDLKGFTRRLMKQMEEDLGTKLDWVAVDHYNTGHPHTHIVVRGKDDGGHDLIIAREYISQGMRERASEIVTFDLGPRSDLAIENRLQAEVEQERFTSLDRNLLREVDADGIVRSGAVKGDAFHQSLRAGRLQKLRRLGLADEVAPGKWRLTADLEPILRRMGDRGDIIKTMHREMAREDMERAASEYAIYDPADSNTRRLIGQVVVRGVSDEINDRHYLIVDGVDGRAHYVDIGRADAIEALPEGAIVAIEPKRAEARQADQTIAEIAAANGGRYSVDIHLHHDPTATTAFAEAHIRRLEAMRRAGAGLERQPDGTWTIAPDHAERAVGYERVQTQVNPVVIETLSPLALGQQIEADGATWLDRELINDATSTIRDAGFGRKARDALDRRRQWLVQQELAREEQGKVIYRANMLGLLRQREVTRVAGRLSGELGLRYVEQMAGGRIEGVYRRRLDLTSGRFALIEKSREFTLVPWRPVLERSFGKLVVGVSRGEAISWTLGQQRGGPSIS